MLRVGIDVGGTFTDVVAVEADSREIVARVKIPTTHQAEQGVAAGIVAGLRALLRSPGVDPAAIAFIAHSTTQATNALLEGDLASVGVLAVAEGPFAWLAHRQIRFAPLALEGGGLFAPCFFEADGEAVLDGCELEGLEALAVSAPFGVDRPELEAALVERARARGFAATSGHEVSGMYGLRARTRTAALNAAILPRMLRTARMTAQAVNEAGIAVPLMIMRSDGGVMDVREVERRPILTLLSGPAAGVAGALLHENVTEGIFIEVGGTSADCSAIRGGMPQMRPARIGGHRTMLRTVDVRTLAVAGGSLVALDGARVRDVGPRSAHIAGFRYASFCGEDEIAGSRWEPQDGYAALRSASGAPIAFTPTCAANLLGLVPGDAFSYANPASVQRAFAIAAQALGTDAKAFAESILARAAVKVRATIEELILDYGLDRETLTIVGGGGGAAALVPYTARALGLAHRLARDAEVISPVGVALALVRDVVERTIVDPTPEQIVAVRREAREAAVTAGADPERIDVAVEIDPRRNLVRATASGATALAESGTHTIATPQARATAAAVHAHVEEDALTLRATIGATSLFEARRRTMRLLALVDERAVVRYLLRDAELRTTTAERAALEVERALEAGTAFGDVGRVLPELYLLYHARIAELRGLTATAQGVALAKEELAGLAPGTPLAVVTVAQRA
jgi:N-methylhydantoinase A/oxoprolinase/acetone carboxylase beta subunit